MFSTLSIKPSVKRFLSLVLVSCSVSAAGIISSPQIAYAAHRTNKPEVRSSLEDGYVVLYTTEFSHQEMLKLAAALAADFSGGSGGFTSVYLANFGRRALRDLDAEVRRKAPDIADELANVLTLTRFLESMDASFDGKRVGLSISGIEMQVGRATYNRTECEFGICVPTPNTYQMYVRIGRNVVGNPSSTASQSSSSPVLEPEFYLMTYGDLRNAFGNDLDAARNHWLRHGVGEGRRSSPAFDVGYYLGQHADLQRAFGSTNYSAAVDHWLRHGVSEGRRSSIVFDVRYYLGKYSDLQRAFGSTNYSAAVDHWLRHGVSEGRQGSSEFDPRFYLSNNPDVANVYGANNYMGAIAHYLEFGRNEGRRGAP